MSSASGLLASRDAGVSIPHPSSASSQIRPRIRLSAGAEGQVPGYSQVRSQQETPRWAPPQGARDGGRCGGEELEVTDATQAGGE